ncbi:LAFE_0C02432g1_1 [Lachancea fermentati]|uniref:Inheritance of peroxisomes protein 1 n=1 Tax=Lachancea fermentati TaxID=4955 RepID=A0A1G4M9I3_LACFM|nr:LAFE_0C02432g1_1 [Lachancea fermentati]
MNSIQNASNGNNKALLNSNKDHSLQSRTPKKKPQSPFKSIRNTLLLRNNKGKKLDADSQTLKYTGDAKIRKAKFDDSVRDLERERKNQRLSAQRVTLFKYDHVKVMNFTIYKQRSNSGSSTSTLSSQSSVIKRINPQDDPVNKNSKRATCLVSNGPLEIYQIITQNINAPPQKMTYLCLGRKGNIVHPILPKLQITRLGCKELKFLIFLFNPERYWEIEFLPPAANEAFPYQIEKDFETVVQTICQYKNDGQSEEIVSEMEKKEVNDLQYLLDDIDSDEDSVFDEMQDETSAETLINAAFRNAIRNITLHENKESHSPLIKRYSSYYGLPSPSLVANQNRRSLSVPFEFPSRRSNNFQIERSVFDGGWMDISFEDVYKKT